MLVLLFSRKFLRFFLLFFCSFATSSHFAALEDVSPKKRFLLYVYAHPEKKERGRGLVGDWVGGRRGRRVKNNVSAAMRKL